MSESLSGSCFCGAVSYTVRGDPVLRAYCHCTNCQRLSGSPFIHTIHFPASAFAWTHSGAPAPPFPSLDPSVPFSSSDPPSLSLASFTIPAKPHKTRFRCAHCGVCVASHNAATRRCSIWGAHLARDADGRIVGWERVRPTAHIFYGTRMLDVADALGKWEGYEGVSERIA